MQRNRSQSMVATSTLNNSSKRLISQRSLDIEARDPFHEEDESVILEGDSQIFQNDDTHFLAKFLPARFIGSSWHLIFSTGKEHLKSIVSCNFFPRLENAKDYLDYLVL